MQTRVGGDDEGKPGSADDVVYGPRVARPDLGKARGPTWVVRREEPVVPAGLQADEARPTCGRGRGPGPRARRCRSGRHGGHSGRRGGSRGSAGAVPVANELDPVPIYG